LRPGAGLSVWPPAPRRISYCIGQFGLTLTLTLVANLRGTKWEGREVGAARLDKMLLRAPANTLIGYLRRDAIRRGCCWPAARLL
jgi:hypothetical protein